MSDNEINETEFKTYKNLPSSHLLGTGTPMCAGCGGLEVLNQIYNIVGDKSIFVNAAGCMTLLSVYPFTPFRGSWLYTSMSSAPAGAQGVRDALDLLIEKKRISPEEDMQVVVLTGDGSAYGMGLSATSSSMDRNLDYLYICYDNEGYGNTGQQFSSATPHGAKTSTSAGSRGYPGFKKDLFAIWTAHNPVYAATVTAAEPLDLARKIEKAMSLHGSKMIIALSPCPVGWNFDPKETVHVGKAAVQTGIWPLKEYMDGRVTHTKIPEKRKPVEEYLMLQGRFRHLFESDQKHSLVEEIQKKVDLYWSECGET